MAATWTQVWTPVHEPGGNTEDQEEENLRGWVRNTEEAEDVREQLQVAECITFVGDRKGKGFGNGIFHLQNPDGKLIHMPRVRFSDIKDKVVSADGVPFVIVSGYNLRCMYGKDKNQTAKRKNEELADQAMKEDHPLPRKRRYRRMQGSTKKGCPAMIEMKEVIRFTDYDTNDDSGMSKRAISDHIRAALRNGDKFNFERRIYIRLPSKADHQSVHALGKDCKSLWSKRRVSKKIRQATEKRETLSTECRVFIRLPSHLDHQSTHSVGEDEAEEPVTLEDVPRRDHTTFKHDSAVKCRQKLELLKDLTYLGDVEELGILDVQLGLLYMTTQLRLKSKSGVIGETPVVAKPRKRKAKSAEISASLPARKKGLVTRVGAAADGKKESER